MDRKRLEKKLNKKLAARFSGAVSAQVETDLIRVKGKLADWEEIVEACAMCVQKNKENGRTMHVVNDIEPVGFEIPPMRLPQVNDEELEGETPDVLIIGGGISGASIARELTKWKLRVLLVEKESDLALQASGRNDGEVHPGVDLSKGSLKQHYVVAGNRMYPKVCKELQVPYKRCGQYVGFKKKWMYPVVWAYAWQKRHVCGVDDTCLMGGEKLHKLEKGLHPDIKFAMCNPKTGVVCPYGLTIAYAENAVLNGAKVSLNTAVLGMDIEKGRIKSVLTNRGRIYPRLVINAAGVFAEDIAQMAGDRFFSIHPRKGTNSILDKKTGGLVKGIASVKTLKQKTAHTKGGGIVHTVHDNILVGPDAVETFEKENFATEPSSIDAVFAKQKQTAPDLSERDIITYFTGVRPATFEEDFVIEKGRRTKNLIHCAGIQSPGLTTAPVVALDIEKMAVEMLGKEKRVEKNKDFNPVRKAIPALRDMPDEKRDALIKQNPDYGVIVCRCEEISKGEILDALHSPIPVPTVDGIKKRLRPGMGRCQGGFCMPLVMKIISEANHVPLEEVRKTGKAAVISYGPTKGAGLRRPEDEE